VALTFTSFSFDQPEYNPGQTITLTVDYTSTDLAAASDVTSAVTVTLTDAAGTLAQASDGSASFPQFTVATPADTAQPVTVTATDNRTAPGTWALVSSTLSGTAAPFTGVAVLTSTA
jgi:hypothetical protein